VESKPRLLISVAEAARMTGLSKGTATKLYLSGEWPSIQIGRRRLIVLSDLEKWVDERKAAA
jgi:excisionase family DNA binding protein